MDMRLIMGMFLLLASSSALASEVRCDNCTEAAYKANALAGGGVGTRYVYDLVKGISRKYEISSSCEEGRVCSSEATPMPVEPDFSNMTVELAGYHAATAGQMSSWFTLHADSSIHNLTVFDVGGPGAGRTQLASWLTNTQAPTIRNALPAAGVALHSLIAAALNIFKNSVGQTNVTVVLADGGQITLVYEPINNTVTVIEGSIADKFGNIVPRTIGDLDGAHFDYSHEPNGPAERKMKDYLSIFGVRVTGSVHWVCVGDSRPVCSPY